MEKIRLFIKGYAVFISLCLLMFVNLFYMHHEVYILNYPANVLSRPIFFCMVDVLVTFLFFYLLTLGKRKFAFVLTYIFIMLFVIANVIYSRFFAQYITLDVLSTGVNFQGTWWISYLHDAFRLSDLLLIVTTFFFVFGVKKIKNGIWFKDIIVIIAMFFCSFCVYVVHATREECVSLRSWAMMSDWFEKLDFNENLIATFRQDQEPIIFNNGILKAQLYYNIVLHSKSLNLSEAEIEEIDKYIEKRDNELVPLTDSCIIKGTPNVIFILVESYISEASEKVIGGKEITPNLNNLMKEKGTYANLRMSSQKAAGGSSDAQITYFTGLIPLSSGLSLPYVVRDSIIGLPNLLKTQKGYTTYITLPTPANFWHQNEVNKKYGIDTTISGGDDFTHFWCDDERLFNVLRTQNLKEPFFNLIVTLSMHGAYDDDFLMSRGIESPFDYPKEYTKEFCHYLDRCYYTDMQIGKYLKYLKQEGHYDNSLIIITSDHQVGRDVLKREVNDKDLPLIIANSGIPSECFERNNINQIDLYPTLLDMFEIKSEWRGLGYSILRDGYTPIITPKSREISDKILRGNYFAH